MFVNSFIKRPVFTSVCAIIILLVGAISIPTLPAEQYPEIAPPQVTVSTNYVGASAEVVEDTVTTIIEREINGVEGMRYINSSSSNDGTSTITVTFEAGRDLDIAAVDVQNRVSIAEPQLPEQVRQVGVTVSKQTNNLLLGMGLFSPNKEYDNVFLSNYADLYIVDALQRIKGVSEARIFGERRYAMRLWLDPNKLASRNLTAQDVIDAVEEQNLQVGAGQIGQPPTPDGQMYQIDLRAVGRLTDVSEFEDIVISSENGTLVKLKDVGRAELGAQSYSSFLRFRGQEAVGIGIFPIPGSNALEVARNVKNEMVRLKERFPPGMDYKVAFDTTQFVEESLKEVVITLFMSVGLVVAVIFLFLQDWRTTLIPVITIPLALIGTFAFIKAFGFSINTLTLFGLTLATGMVVDDAIVVVEDIAGKIQDEGMPPRQAASEAMRELTGAVIATSLVLMAVFVPVAFFPGATGQIYKQFALTIAFSIAISTFLALTLTPSLSALLLRRKPRPRGVIGWLFARFNGFLEWTRRGYQRSLTRLTRLKGLVVLLFILSLGVTGWLYTRVPTGFLPDEDQGYFITIVQGPEGASLNYTSDVMSKIETELLKLPETVGTFAVGGFGLGGSGNTANRGAIFTTLTPFSDRSGESQSAEALIGKIRGIVSSFPEARILPVNPPAIRGLGNVSGFQFQLQDRLGNNPLGTLVQASEQLLARANQTPGLEAVFTTFGANSPQMLIEIDRNKAKALQVEIDEILNTLQSFLGGRYVNDFNLQRRSYRVYVQADQQFRSNPKDINSLYVRSENDQMIPLSNVVKVTPTTGAQAITHYNLFRSIEISGSPAPGFSSGQAIKTMERLAAQVLPASLGYEWGGISLDEQESGNQAPIIFALGLVFVFLVLAAQYENYVDPFVIMLAVPLALFGALLAQSLRGIPNDVYGQVGLVMLIGLASKNSILIVEFANQLRAQGLPITKAAVEASQQRLRPILMTAISTLLGIFPLVIAVGAGAKSRQSLGTAVFGGMLIATFLSLFVVPVLYIVIGNISDRLNRRSRSQSLEPSPEEVEVSSGTRR